MFNEVGECVGIAFQSLAGSDAENIGYVIPTPVIQHFLTDFRYTTRSSSLNSEQEAFFCRSCAASLQCIAQIMLLQCQFAPLELSALR